MTSRIAIVPGTPMLIPQVAASAAGELEDVRQAARERMIWAGGASRRVKVLAQDPGAASVVRCQLCEPVSLSALGLPTVIPTVAPDGSGTHRSPTRGDSDHRGGPPVSVLVAAWLAHACDVVIDEVWLAPTDPRLVSIPPELADSQGLLVVADGSSTRTPKAPGSFVEGAVAFDESLVDSVGRIDTAFFVEEKRAGDAERFGVHGLGAWAVIAGLIDTLGGEWKGEVDLCADPFGVFYVVAGWSDRTATTP
jgi:hypothetical protein